MPEPTARKVSAANAATRAAGKAAAAKAATGSPEPVVSHTGDPTLDATWARLTARFDDDWVEKLPKVLRRDDPNKGRCGAENPNYSADGHYCGGWHARAVHLDYIGHAGITMRLNDTVGPAGWNWEPMAYGPEGLPLVGREFWIRLTILGVTKLGVADDFRSSKEAIGDALRNAAMRFGIATYLWSKSDHALNAAQASDDRPEPSGAQPTPAVSPETHAPNGQPWRLPDGTPNPDALAPHQRKVWDAIGRLTDAEAQTYNDWHRAEHLPQVRFLDEYQAAAALGKLEEVVGQRPPA